MSLRLWPVLAALLGASMPAQAAEPADFIAGTYSSEEGCQALAQHTQSSGDFLLLTSKGISGNQFSCDFVSVLPRTGKPGWVAIALCEEPGYSHPELISILPRGEATMEVGVPDSPYSDEGLDSPDMSADPGAADGDAVSGPDEPPAPIEASPPDPAQGEGLTIGGAESAGPASYVGIAGSYKRCQNGAD